VEALELRSIPGWSQKPKAPAQGLFNIRKALEVLGKNKRMPVQYVFAAEEIQAGDGEVIRGILGHARKAFGHHIKQKKRVPMASKGQAAAGGVPRELAANAG